MGKAVFWPFTGWQGGCGKSLNDFIRSDQRPVKPVFQRLLMEIQRLLQVKHMYGYIILLFPHVWEANIRTRVDRMLHIIMKYSQFSRKLSLAVKSGWCAWQGLHSGELLHE